MAFPTSPRRRRALASVLAWAALCGAAGARAQDAAYGARADRPADAIDPATLPVVELGDRDELEVRSSCRLVFPERPVPDDAGDGVVIVVAPDVLVVCEGELRGAVAGVAPDAYAGTGIAIRASGVTLRGARVSGYRCGIRVTGARDVVLEDTDVSDNFRQRLRSTPEAEDASDWLWPHANDANEWLDRYGAGIWAEDCTRLTVRRSRARDGQNGLCLVRTSDSAVYDCDFSFLSGWGVALWRSSGNAITRNALDFCIRGYSHGVYNRGQDSAGILLFEQSSENLIAENSVTHGGDGLFGFAGKEALGEHPAPEEGFEHEGRGCNRNRILGNDFSYAAAHGLELTFSFRNWISGNRFAGNAICGIWGGYSHGTWILANTFEDNGDAGYGLERGAINAEHATRNLIYENTFRRNACGVHLWWDEDPGLAATPWARANDVACAENRIYRNRFEGDAVAIHVRACSETRVGENTLEGVLEEVRAEGDAPVERPFDVSIAYIPTELLGETRPFGARAHLAGREHILMTEWGPYDHEGPYLRPLAAEERGVRAFEVLGRFDRAGGVDLDGCEVDVDAARLSVRSTRPGGVARYTVFAEADAHAEGATESTRSGGTPERVERSGVIVDAPWSVTCFAWTADPREDAAAWRAEAERGVAFEVSDLSLPFGSRGPSELAGVPEAVRAAALPADRFGTLATTRVRLSAGRWRVRTTSDDGIRVRADGLLLVDDWTWHPPKTNDAEIALAEEREVEIEVEHFELDGHATLAVALEPLP